MTRRKDGLRVTRAAFDAQGSKGEALELMVISVPSASGRPDVALTAAEREVAGLLLSGASPQQIARRRASSVRTVSNQLLSIYRKHGVRSREELALVLLAGFEGPLA